MKDIAAFVTKIKKILTLHRKLTMVLVALSYLFFTVYYMGPAVYDCRNTVYGFGDNTAGPIWRNQADPSAGPLWGYEDITNYPYGEDLYTPVSYSASGQYSFYWVLSKVAGSVCGYNLVNVTGFLTSSLVMFGFVYRLLKSRSIAWLAGFAVSFSPYFQMKVGGHPGYGYQALLIGSVWLFYELLVAPNKRKAVALGAIIAFCGYFDPYFSLLISIMLIPLLLSWLALSAWKKNLGGKDFRGQLRGIIVTAVTAALLLLPLVSIYAVNKTNIENYVSGSRGNVLMEARACSNLPHEYALPFVLHPVFNEAFGSTYKNLVDQLHNKFTCGIGEDTVGISLTVLMISSLGAIIIAWEKVNRRRIGLGRTVTPFDVKLIVLGVTGIVAVAAVMALPPYRKWGIPTPSYVLLELTTTWRTLTRLFVLVNIGLVVIFSIALKYFSVHFKKNGKIMSLLFVLIFLAIFIEYQAFRPFAGNTMSTFNYEKDANGAYYWLKEQNDIQVVAEYPLERHGGESDAISYYVTMQSIHNKKLFNSILPNSPQEHLRSGLKNLSDPQTIRALHTLGIQAIIVHGVAEEDVESIPYLDVVYSGPQSAFNLTPHTPLVKNDNVVIAKISNSTPRVEKLIELKSGFPRNLLIIKSAVDWHYEVIDGAELELRLLSGKGEVAFSEGNTPVCFSIKMAAETDSGEVTFTREDGSTFIIAIGAEYREVRIEAAKSIRIDSQDNFNMRITDLGCKD